MFYLKTLLLEPPATRSLAALYKSKTIAVKISKLSQGTEEMIPPLNGILAGHLKRTLQIYFRITSSTTSHPK
jgi:hypothetical protein